MIEQPVFSMQTGNSQQRMDAKNALADINRKHQEVSRIADSIMELQQLFIDVSVLVSAQGAILDQTVIHIEKAVDETDQGVKNMEGAVKYQKKSRKRMRCLLFILVIIIILAVVIPVSMVKK